MTDPRGEVQPSSAFQEPCVVQLATIGALSYAATILADPVADVVTVERPAVSANSRVPEARLSDRTTMVVNLKSTTGYDEVLSLVDGADAMVEGMRRGAPERLGFGPDDCQSRNPALILGRRAGRGQLGPIAAIGGPMSALTALSTAVQHAVASTSARMAGIAADAWEPEFCRAHSRTSASDPTSSASSSSASTAWARASRRSSRGMRRGDIGLRPPSPATSRRQVPCRPPRHLGFRELAIVLSPPPLVASQSSALLGVRREVTRPIHAKKTIWSRT